MNTRTVFILLAAGVACLGLCRVAGATLIYEYNAGLSPDDGSNATWEPSVNNSNLHGGPYARNWSLTGWTFNASAGSSYPGIPSSYSFAGSPRGGTTTTFGKSQLPLGGTATNNTGASATFEIWVKPNRTNWSGAGNETLFETGGTTSGAHIQFVDTAGAARVRFRTRLGGNSGSSSATFDLTDASHNALLSDFIQIVGVVDPAAATEKTRLYINGGPSAGGFKVTNTSFKDWQDGNNNSGLGRINGTQGGAGTGGNFLGDIAILRLYDAPMSDAEVLAAYNAVVPEPSAFLLAVVGLLAMLACGWRRRSRNQVLEFAVVRAVAGNAKPQ